MNVVSIPGVRMKHNLVVKAKNKTPITYYVWDTVKVLPANTHFKVDLDEMLGCYEDEHFSVDLSEIDVIHSS